MQGIVPNYLEKAMSAFAEQQEQVRASMQKTMGSMSSLFPFGNMEEVSRQNVAMMERAMTMFSPFPRSGQAAAGPKPEDEIAALRAEVERLRKELAAKK
jgi:polyhydroxyalkanoate synthesis regulator protein